MNRVTKETDELVKTAAKKCAPTLLNTRRCWLRDCCKAIQHESAQK